MLGLVTVTLRLRLRPDDPPPIARRWRRRSADGPGPRPRSPRPEPVESRVKPAVGGFPESKVSGGIKVEEGANKKAPSDELVFLACQGQRKG